MTMSSAYSIGVYVLVLGLTVYVVKPPFPHDNAILSYSIVATTNHYAPSYTLSPLSLNYSPLLNIGLPSYYKPQKIPPGHLGVKE